jgi:hypothetical protein
LQHALHYGERQNGLTRMLRRAGSLGFRNREQSQGKSVVRAISSEPAAHLETFDDLFS